MTKLIGKMTSLADVSPAKWFLLASSSGKHLCVRARPRPGVGTGDTLGYVELARLSPSKGLDPTLRVVARGEQLFVFEISDVRISVPVDLTAIYPDLSREEARVRCKPGALIITNDEYRMLVANEDQHLTISLSDGSLHHGGNDKQLALVSRWRLLYANGDQTRELYSVYI